MSSAARKFRLTGRERWRTKKWYNVLSPTNFGSVIVASTPVDEAWKLLGRNVEATLYDLTGDITQVHAHLYFQIWKVDGENAYTIFKGHELARDYVRSLTRRKSSRITAIFSVTTKDGYLLRLTVMAWTTYKCNTSQQHAIRRILMDVTSNIASTSTFDEFVVGMVFGDYVQQLFNEAKRIYPLRKVEFVKSKLIAVPTPEGPKKAVIIPKAGVLEAPYATSL
ncbi:MAG: 30S ribosomal protein S3ae [Ignisphaera sp.]|nr:30S ribosomal protein S3ae [Ignisphaera sp.]MCX8168361.1 30S ribosomal protein S3ae [Ignisphaera sp.]MDW8086201.1 30S ribosomal protein S3ae [Ignisphaera sp.]